MTGLHDLREAFYSVIVQYLHDLPTDEDDMAEFLDSADIPLWLLPQVDRLLAQPGLLDKLLDRSHIAALVAEAHRDSAASRSYCPQRRDTAVRPRLGHLPRLCDQTRWRL